MDTLAHYLWAVVIYWYFRKPRKWLSGITGALPDLSSFGILFIMSFAGAVAFEPGGPPPVEVIPNLIFTLYNITHSLLPIGIVAGLLYWLKREWWHLSWGWILHILADIPTHTRAYFPTPFLWPITGWTFDGIRWGQWWFMLLNYGLLACAMTALFLRDRKRKKNPGNHR